MIHFPKILKKLLYPVTLLTILSGICLVVLVEALYANYTSPNLFSVLYIAIVIRITGGIWVLYVLDRFLLRKTSYKIVLLSEIGIASLLFLMFSYQNSKTSIRFDTDSSFVLVLFDNLEESSAPFERKGIFNKELFIRDTNIIHVHPNLAFKKGLTIETPKDWKQTTTDQSSILIDGKTVKFIFVTNSELPKSYLINTEKYLDSLLQITNTK